MKKLTLQEMQDRLPKDLQEKLKSRTMKEKVQILLQDLAEKEGL